MSKRKVLYLDRSKPTTEGSLNSYLSVWMAHWKVAKPPPSHQSTFLSLNCETRESESSSGHEVTSSLSHMPKLDREFCKVPVKSTVNVKAVATNVANIVDGTAVAMVSQNSSNEEPVSASSPVIGLPLLDNAMVITHNDNPSTGQKRPLTFLTENCHEGVLGHHQTFLSLSSPLEATKRETFCSENPSGKSDPVVDVNTTTTCTFVDSNEGLTAGQPKLSPTTHQFFSSEKTGTLLSKRGQIFQESTVYTNHEENVTFGQLLSLSMNGNYHGTPGVKLQPLWSLTDSESHESPSKGRTSAVASKNESSAEINTLDMDVLPKKRLSGQASSFPKKEPSSGKGSGSMVKIDLRDRKRKFLSLTTTSSSTENGEPSPSKTRCFEAEHLLPHEDPGSHSNTVARFGDHGEPEQRQPWMEQLEASEPGHPPVEKVVDLLGRISMQMKVPSETVGGDTLGDQLKGLGCGHSARSARDGISTSVDNTHVEKGRRIRALLLDPWIRRWCHGQAGAFTKKKEQMPSVAAMALMVKAVNGFNPCEFKRRGSFIMWDR